MISEIELEMMYHSPSATETERRLIDEIYRVYSMVRLRDIVIAEMQSGIDYTKDDWGMGNGKDQSGSSH